MSDLQGKTFWRWRAMWIVALLAVCALPLVWPGDASFLQDEAKLLLQAEACNHQPVRMLGVWFPFSLASHGLLGTHGVNYGPAAEWFYQLLLLLPHDFPWLIVVRAAVVTAATVVGVWWIGKYAGLGRWFVLVIMLSPWVWWYSRGLWDNSFCIPLSALCVGSYLGFVATRRRAFLGLAFASLLLLPLVHFMAFPLVGAILVDLVAVRYRAIRRHWLMLSLIFAVIAVAGWRYVPFIRESHGRPIVGNAVTWQSCLFPLLGANDFSGLNLDWVLGGEWLSQPGVWTVLMELAIGVSLLAYPMVWAGMVLAAREAWKAQSPIRATLARVCLVTLGLQVLLDGVLRVIPLPHYYNGTWIIYGVFAWLTTDVLARWIIGRIAVGTFAAACLGLILLMMIRIHVDGGVRGPQGFTRVANQQRVCDQISQYPPDSLVDVRGTMWERFPITYRALRMLRRGMPDPRLPRSVLMVRYADAPPDARLQLVALPVPDK